MDGQRYSSNNLSIGRSSFWYEVLVIVKKTDWLQWGQNFNGCILDIRESLPLKVGKVARL